MPAIKREIARNTHSTGRIRFGLVFLLALALSACGSATPVVIPSATPVPPSATMLAPTITQPTETLRATAAGTNQPAQEALLIPGPDVAFQDVQFTLPTELGMEVHAQVAPAMDILGEPYPARAEFALANYSSQNNSFEPQLQIYPVRELGQSGTQTVDELKELLAERPAVLMTGIGIPILPPQHAGQLIDVQVEYLTFGNGSGVRVLTQFAQGMWPIHNAGLVYVFQGLTSDGAYYISAFLPVAASFLPDQVDDPDLVPPVDGTPYPKFGSQNFDTEHGDYHRAVTRKLNATPPQEFTPNLSALDSLIQSLRVGSAAASNATLMATPALTMTTTPLPAAGIGRIAFASDRDGDDDIYVMNADGSGLILLTNTSAGERLLDGSPDGARIAFTLGGENYNDEIYVMNADGSQVRRLTNNPASDRFPAWSPNGRRIAFVSDRDGEFPGTVMEIYVMNADGSNQTRLTHNQATNTCPAWSPDGKQLAFSTYQTESEARIDVMNSNGSGERLLVDTPGKDRCPVWSPDGIRIAFTSQSGSSANIYVVNSDGSNLINLTDHSSENTSPRWSPDGQSLVFASRRDGNSEIYRIGVDGRGLTNLTNHSSFDGYPDWLPGGPSLPVESPTTGSAAVPCVNAPPTRLRVGLFVFVNPDPPLPNNVRSDAGKTNSLVGDIQPGQAMKILEGPKCADGWVWWKVRALETELVGWTAEGDQQNYWLIPCSSRQNCGP